MKVTISNYTFREYVNLEKSGNAILGWVTFWFHFGPDHIEINDLAVRLSADGTQHLSAPKRNYKTNQTESGWGSVTAYKFSDETYKTLVNHVFGTEEVIAAVEKLDAKSAPIEIGADVNAETAVMELGGDIPY